MFERFMRRFEKHPVRWWLAICVAAFIGCAWIDSAVAHAQPPAQWDVTILPQSAAVPLGWEPFSTYTIVRAGYSGDLMVVYRRRVR